GRSIMATLAGSILYEGVPMPPVPLHNINGTNRNPFDMKRPGMDDYKDFPKRQKNLSGDGYADALAQGKFEMRLLVGSKSAGAVIGKGGDNIKRLRSQFDASVSVPDSSAPERIFIVKFDDSYFCSILTMVSTIENLADMVKDILPRLEEHGSGGGDNPKIEVRMIVHQSHAGALIGRAGTKIKELREATRANIKVFSHCAPNSTDRVVLIGGEDNAISDACKTIMETIRDIPVKGHTKQYDTMNYDPTYINEYGGFAPMGGAPFRGPPMGGNGGPPGGPGMFGPPGGRGGGGGRNQGGQMGGGPPMGGAPFPPSNNFPPMGGNYGGGPPAQITTQVTIPSELGGTIIGRGGERINRIREESGAHIVLEPHTGAEERIITISGSQTQIHAAQYLLQTCVRSSMAGNTGVRPSMPGRKYIGDTAGGR
ncbi:hrpk-1, partial [Pristionchus pacificus]|uniref:K Homology domain containing protein n=1 Tax=Pristionchus pacificus TaxID=54126 RepID=A0A2A6CEX7_PRIPA